MYSTCATSDQVSTEMGDHLWVVYRSM